MNEKDLDFFLIPHTVFGSEEWKEVESREFEVGPEALLNEILDKRLWSNAEITWVLRRLVYFYGKKDILLQKAPPERLLQNMVDVLRVFFLIFDQLDPDLDDNVRSYVCSKLADSTWGITGGTREYLARIKD
jgi:hypothetical protein